MKARIIAFCCWVIGVSAGLIFESFAVATGSYSLLMAAVAFMSIDAYRMQIWRFRSGFAAKPWGWVVLVLFFWWLMLPWYLGLRLNILFKTARLKERRFPGYVQPWGSPEIR